MTQRIIYTTAESALNNDKECHSSRTALNYLVLAVLKFFTAVHEMSSESDVKRTYSRYNTADIEFQLSYNNMTMIADRTYKSYDNSNIIIFSRGFSNKIMQYTWSTVILCGASHLVDGIVIDKI